MHYTSLLCLLAFFLISCETKPSLQEESPQEETSKAPTREEVVYFGKYFPKGWD